MDTIQKALNAQLAAAPYEVFSHIIAEKLTANGISLTDSERRQLTEHLKSNATDNFFFRRRRWWENRNFTVDITPEDVEALHSRFTEFLEHQLPKLVSSTVEQFSTDILQDLHRSWRAESRRQNREHRAFLRRLHQHWGEALKRLRMYLAISRELGAALNTALRSDPDIAESHLVDILTRTHARACQVADEIICLLEGGFADGAMGRWRTLHEIAVVALFLDEHGEELAKRYSDHQVVESLRAAREYQKFCERMGYEQVSASEIQQLERACNDAANQYGRPFRTQYGWAAEVLKLDRPNFSDIEHAIGIDHLRPYYRMASHNVHANPKGAFFKLGLLSDDNILLTGPTNAGLADPGHATAISLLHVSGALVQIKPTLDSLIILRVLLRLEAEIGEAFMDAHVRLEG
jgi:hypothetical protein